MLQKSKQINIPPEPTRAGAQDGSTIDNTATDRGMDITMNEDTAHETTTAAAEHSRQVYKNNVTQRTLLSTKEREAA